MAFAEFRAGASIFRAASVHLSFGDFDFHNTNEPGNAGELKHWQAARVFRLH